MTVRSRESVSPRQSRSSLIFASINLDEDGSSCGALFFTRPAAIGRFIFSGMFLTVSFEWTVVTDQGGRVPSGSVHSVWCGQFAGTRAAPADAPFEHCERRAGQARVCDLMP